MQKNKALKTILIVLGIIILVGVLLLITRNTIIKKSIPPLLTSIAETQAINPAETVNARTTPVYGFDDPRWWDHAVFYEIFVRSFYDSNGDGVGDFNGITEKLDYLNDGNPETSTDLGINALWLMPIFPSPSYHGYDVTDYFTVNPQYGTEEDFKNLIDEAHKRGIHVIIDFVINHTSNQHPWFIEAQDPLSKYHNWYIWSDVDPGYLGPWGEKVWHQTKNGDYYYGVFSEGMPDLNFENPDVTAKIEEAASYWFNDKGVDGFRVDGARHLIEQGEIQENSRLTYSWFQNFMKAYKKWNSSTMTVGEIWDSSYVTTTYVKTQSFDMVFNFDLASVIIATVGVGDAQNLSANITNEINLYKGGGMGTFLTNHDMNRVMSQFGEEATLAKHAATILLTIPGTPFLYYGEEIGMVGVKPDEQIRSPMQWSAEDDAGFTLGVAWEIPNFSFKTVNITVQTDDKDSLLSLYRNLIHTRLEHAALLDGDYITVETSNTALYAGIRQQQNDLVLTVVNLKNVSIEQPVFKFKGDVLPGKYLVKGLVGSEEVDSELEIVKNGDLLEFSFFHPITAHQNLLVQLISTN